MPSSLISTFRYRDCTKAIDWLCVAFGFAKKAVYPDEQGQVMHAELTFGETGMIMLGSIRETPFSAFLKQPADVGGETQTIYAIVQGDLKTHYENAKAHGAEILLELKEQSYGGSDYTCKDLEGHVWTFGTYDPWKS